MSNQVDINILKEINKLTQNTENQFELVDPFDQTALVMWLSKAEKDTLIRRGWRFSW